ncbi:uncharacterized protein LOC110453718 [Mizuhopecten yessoensis]|uniref:uncharacterized protein LOC110453718 n=1 Tax=Mizuhopecten yessoensis TaxID=6573 RepID=UPI000B45C4E5|nr:uncharacterized protein LOC110453718 [Mizuhopecten yessoensis]
MSNKEEKPRMEILVAVLLLLTQRTYAVNFTNILQQYALMCGHSHLCNWSAIYDIVFPARIYDGPDICPHCACDRQCIERGDCCPDVLFPHPGLACLNLAIVNPNNVRKHALALIECPANTPAALAEKCSGKYSSMEKLTLTPVASASSLVVYRNKFCAECFKEENTIPWSLNIDCPGMIDLNHLTSYDAIIDMIEGKSCSMMYRSPNNQKYVNCDRPELRSIENIEGCNTTGRWVKYDPDIEWACRTVDHRYKYYKNIFCYMCNPGQHRRNDHVVGSCNQTGEWAVFDKSLQHACETSPAAPEAYPFKNVFCFQCNRNTNNDEIFLDSTIDIESDERVWMESLFKLRIKSFDNLQVYIESPMDRASTTNTTYNSPLHGMTVEDRGKEVGQWDVYDPDVKWACENYIPDITHHVSQGISDYGNIFCRICNTNSNSKTPIDTCNEKGHIEPTNVTMITRCDVYPRAPSMLTYKNKFCAECYPMDTKLSNEMFYQPNIYFTDTDKWCDSGIDPTRQQFLLHTSFFIAAMMDRLDTEEKLVNLTSSNFSVIVQDTTCHVQFEYDQEALELPTTIHTADVEGSCFLVSHDEFSYASDKYKLSYVSKFLACQHVEIDGDQYESEDGSFHVNLLPNGPRLHFGEFRKTSISKRVQICLDDFEKMMTSQIVADENSTKETAMFVLQVISFVCVCLSILGLFSTFLTYCFFSSLRTLPGKNNMCLIVSLFFSQFLTQLGISQPKDKMLCAIFGLMIHYFWLATFLSMNVCSYHMFQVFAFPLRQVKSKRRECSTHLRYLFYCLGVPALIIAVYVTVSVIVYDSIGYGNNEKCFIASLPAFMATFIGPVFLICLVNAVFFCVTVYTISTVPHVSSNKSSRREVSIHIKLFLLTGISWIFQLIDSFVPMSIFSVIVNFVNASQGIFLFIAYSVNRRVRTFYTHRLSSRFTTIASLTKSSKSSSVEEHRV